MSVKSRDLQTSHAYHFKIALQRLWHLNVSIAESYLMKCISWADSIPILCKSNRDQIVYRISCNSQTYYQDHERNFMKKKRMPDIIRLGKTWKKHIDGIQEAIRSGINLAVVEGLTNKIRAAFKRSYGFKAYEYRDTIFYLVAGGLRLPPECQSNPRRLPMLTFTKLILCFERLLTD